MQSRIYARLFNLKDRQDLPAGNPAIPYPTTVAYDGSSDQAAPATTPSPYLPQVPKPPHGRINPSTAAVDGVSHADQPAGGNAADIEEQRLRTEAAAAAQEPLSMMGDADGPWSDPNYGVETPNTFAERERASKRSAPVTASETGEVGYNSPGYQGKADQELGNFEQRRAFAADPDGSAGAAEDPAKKTAQLNDSARIALGLGSVPITAPNDRPKSAKELKREEKDAKRAAKDEEYNARLQAALPYEDPQTPAEKEQNRLAELRFRARNPRNEDRGVKGFIREMIENFAFGLSHAQGVPGISVPQALMLGGVGAGAGLANRGWNEQRAAQAQIPEAMQAVKMQDDLATAANLRDTRNASVGIREQAEQRMTDKNARDAEYKEKSLGIQGNYRKEYLNLLYQRDALLAADKKVKADQAQQRIDLLEKRYKLDEKKAGLSAKSTAINTAARKSAALAKLNEQIRDAEDAGDAAAAAKLRSDAKRLEALPIN